MAVHDPRRARAEESFLEGKLLVALPGMPDPRFERSVIFMCAHSLEAGAMGLVVNKPIEGLNFRDLIGKLEISVQPDTPDFPVLFGGPMDTGRGFVLHSSDYDGEDSTLPVSDNVSLTATLDILRAIAEGRGPEQAIFALGYAGWAPGQIESEIRANGWVHCDADPELLFDIAAEAKWPTAFQKLGIDISALTANAGNA
ncbi:MAG: YqgE/AlgH family protein [Alphaproteobacteria bacterium]|nr:YqgE/AlgH family protein [Alphaproteobacteria bacterium]MDE2011305.1 YqgE/AlgH family protein [Alphaproteobacteria bacterium]MDE2073201.1 YqgE/AlgH family protein [Alphaproteobacteria bacterium]MDE2352616.1 YqgE/AlgH family protein [Alphaproteobacteria bacterium]